jgi:hypothetical protein
MGDRIGDDADLRAFLMTLDQNGRDTLRRVLTRDQDKPFRRLFVGVIVRSCG